MGNPSHNNNYNKFIAVKFDNGLWYYDDNLGATKEFTPLSDDVLVAAIDFGADTCTVLRTNTPSSYEGITKGIASGDLECRANTRYNSNAGSGSNQGEFYIEGTRFTTARQATTSINVRQADDCNGCEGCFASGACIQGMSEAQCGEMPGSTVCKASAR